MPRFVLEARHTILIVCEGASEEAFIWQIRRVYLTGNIATLELRSRKQRSCKPPTKD